MSPSQYWNWVVLPSLQRTGHFVEYLGVLNENFKGLDMHGFLKWKVEQRAGFFEFEETENDSGQVYMIGIKAWPVRRFIRSK